MEEANFLLRNKDWILGEITANEFISTYWQKKPLLIRNALRNYTSPITPDELAGLALEDYIESRIILENGNYPWEIKHGPFTEIDFRNLPEKKWTLLVQSVDTFVPEINTLIEKFSFLSKWRIDDVMVSYAPEDGSVGPHYDNYDVFLIQAKGQKVWRIGQNCSTESLTINHPHLRILANFQQEEEFLLNPGDMLYLPPKIAHHGISINESMTFSVGFRAPSLSEIITGFADTLSLEFPEEIRYSDDTLTVATKDTYEITKEHINILHETIRKNLIYEKATSWFGQFMTESRFPEYIQVNEINNSDFFAALANGVLIEKNFCSRFAWAELKNEIELYFDGNILKANKNHKPLIQKVCSSQSLSINDLEQWLDDDEALELIFSIYQKGAFVLSTPDESL